MSLGQNLQFLRKRDNITQERLAEELEVSRQSVSKCARYLTCAGYGHIVGQRECKDYQFHVAFHYFHVKMRLHPRKYGVFDDSGTK